ncbi:DUF2975 domain-containing protein [Terrisporobacter mayombei]|uniref:DUF2975 domain-containing protein n=1 Tax=Terrisporobacter mayombei TaxID=1541 RepID=A0ABY9PZA9_9FIRM|nr:DUF2975 domain-containing protein [Terrisporobacter mayombei]MCC3868231.1 DUF2975 domain-containing protein [Terrisporobacter mayombei]WMT80370.1 hypothetical protein TEMA_06860 [Terrisporobacter mayombei]
MRKESLIRFLRRIIIGFGILGAVVYTQVFPILGHGMEELLPRFSTYYMPWLIFIWITASPCYMILFYGWKVTEQIEQDTIFTRKSAQLLKKVSWWALVDTIFFTVGNLVFFFIKAVGVVYFFASLVGVFMGLAVVITAAMLPHLAYKAAELNEENELTI